MGPAGARGEVGSQGATVSFQIYLPFYVLKKSYHPIVMFRGLISLR